MLRVLIILISTTCFACTLYKSSGREAIVDNKNNIVGPFFAGLHHNLNLYRQCFSSQGAPEFLKEPLTVLENSFEPLGFTTFKQDHTQFESDRIIVYHWDEKHKSHTFCTIEPTHKKTLSKLETVEAINFGINTILRMDTEN